MFADVTEEKSGYGGRMKSTALLRAPLEARRKQGRQEWPCYRAEMRCIRRMRRGSGR
jgi:hypothetical protein